MCDRNQTTNFLEIIEILSAKYLVSEKLLNDTQDFSNVIVESLLKAGVI